MATTPDSDKKKIEVKVNAGTVLGSSYAQVGIVSVADDEVTLEFVFIHPQNQETGHVVSRITMPKDQARKLADVMQNTFKKHDAKKS